ncbi:hypothetical protein H257_03459 [Aphanomyces astaci]|uniref:Transmembrane protein n=1 Tax=Aphanomyces astaci TaxID=112090 RepID=W4GZ27_APHAT|nr:hypothetical protein H257_03459 [Aphanomyces astaci]ETV84173.1 hypothetical protein H257_03459 [Aphanomyces astaci]|eukprot:XP_009825865.1 hypothetical protein H257_03459 [Aphanomyces astaci]
MRPPVAIAVPVTPTSDYNNLPQAQLRQNDASNADVAMAIHVGDPPPTTYRVLPALMSGLEQRLVLRKAVIFQLFYFTVSFILFLPPWFPSALAWAFGILGVYASHMHVDIRRQRATVCFAIFNGVLATCFLSEVVFSLIRVTANAVDLDYAHCMLWMLNVPVLCYASSKAIEYHQELTRRLARGVTVVSSAAPVHPQS